jgi:hypothetical protein
VSRVLLLPHSFNDNGFAIGKLVCWSAKLLISDGATLSLGEEVICLLSLGWPLRWCRRQVTGVGFLLRGFFSRDYNFPFWLRVLFVKARIFYLFSSMRSVFMWLVT